MNYNDLLKKLAFLEQGIKYNEIQNNDLLALVITKYDKVIFSYYAAIDFYSDKLNTIPKIREELSMHLILLILKLGIHSRSNLDTNQTYEEYQKSLDKLIDQKYGNQIEKTYEQKESK